MPIGPSTAVCNAWLDALCNNSSYAVTSVYIQLHVGDPGAAGTANTATETTRQGPVSFGSAASGAISNDAAITWTNISGSQDATHFSLWDASSSGNFLGSGTITAAAYTAGDTFNIPIGDLDLTLTPAST